MEVIARKYLPLRCPLQICCLSWLLLDRYGAPDWLWYISLVCMGLLWLLYIYTVVVRRELRPVFADEFERRLVSSREAALAMMRSELRQQQALRVHP